MKINGIKALDYREQDGKLVVTMKDTSLEEIIGMDAAVLRVTTDDGDLVECIAGYQVAIVTYEAGTETFTVALDQRVDDTTAKALEAITAQLKRLETGQEVVNGPVVAAARAYALTATEIPDASALEMATLFPTWEDVLENGTELPQGRIINKDGQLYRVVQATVPQAHQEPGGEGMLAVYRPIEIQHAGTRSDPIPWVYGMDCLAGHCYSYNGAIYRVADGGDMIPCVWAPDTPGLWQWEII